jgi:hypothetical protein
MTKRLRLAAALALLATAGCVSQRTGSDAPLEASASVPSPEEVRAKEEAEARERRAAFVDGELRFALEHAAAHPAAPPPASR